jgi:hypothetical protein
LTDQETLALDPSPLSFHHLLPVPLHVLAHPDGDELEKWQRANCGTIDESDSQLCYAFNTPWSPPIALLKTIGPDWPTLKFLLHYEEPGESYYGLCKVVDRVCEDHCLNL